MEQTKKCEVCGKKKPVSSFSKSYKHRCKECVAEDTRNKRLAEKLAKDLAKDMKKQPIFLEPRHDIWEQRRYEIAKEYFCNYMRDASLSLGEEAADDAVYLADKLIKHLKKRNENEG